MAEFDYQYKVMYSVPDPQTYARAGIGFLLSEMVDVMLDVVHNSTTSPQYQMTLWSGHDTTLVPILAALNQWDGIWAMYASQMQWEIYRDPFSSEYYLRVIYNGKELSLPGCPSTLCPWAAAYEFLQKVLPDGNCAEH